MYTHKFIIPDNVRLFLTHEDYIILTEVGLPTQILAQTFVYNEEVLIKNDCVILGSNTHVSDWLLKVSYPTGLFSMPVKEWFQRKFIVFTIQI